jgi:hypothetical protein
MFTEYLKRAGKLPLEGMKADGALYLLKYVWYGGGENAYRYLVGNTAGNRPLVRPNCRWEDNNNIDVVEVGWDGVEY